ncbi:AAA family ATPase [Agrococcus lahaulensis]|uniref:AAA family ATPase n=1 Tax=Agrococcus lahaulensis TaxID=341722 RepID=UPI00040AE4BA|nr:AAA family ATPase [Agrococcus lahaulensis]
MNEAERRGVIASEVAREREYNDGLVRDGEERQRQANANIINTWTETRKVKPTHRGEIVGRIDLGSAHEAIDGRRDFYIGTIKWDGPDYAIYNWIAPIAACTYYRQPADRPSLTDVASSVVGVRSFVRRSGRIADFADEVVAEAPPGGLFPRQRLRVPKAPSGGASVSAGLAITAPIPPAVDTSTYSVPADPRRATGETQQLPARDAPIRAADLLRRELAAPKSAQMATVLATLQPDQYDLITKPVGESQILQGHPGTGKTIIAAHRTAYLLNSELDRDLRPKGHVLLLGPTEEYVQHVRGAIAKLLPGSRHYSVMSIPTLLERLAGLPESGTPTHAIDYLDADSELAELADHAVARARKFARRGTRPTTDDIYAEFQYLPSEPPPGGLKAEWKAYIRQMPETLAEARRLRVRAYRGLLAYIGIRAADSLRLPGHVIVDEAQDIHPIEWHVLGRLGNLGGWTILGDLNQRRTDYTYASWQSVSDLLGLSDDEGSAPVQMLDRGYRSTAQIMRFANQLLPRTERALSSLQMDGTTPTITRAHAQSMLIPKAVEEAETLLTRTGAGTVAVITMEERPVEARLVAKGWQRSRAEGSVWERDGQTIRVLPPARARGLEFDGVVVVEPSAFPENVGRQGVLYTALTRANRFLTVVHHQAMPNSLRTR